MGSMIVRLCAALAAVACVLGPRPAEAQCAYTVNPLIVNALSTGLSGSISVTTGTSCTWTATSPDSWITVAGGTHAGIASVNYTVAVNSTLAARTGTISVAGQTVTVNQAFGSCNYTVNPLTRDRAVVRPQRQRLGDHRDRVARGRPRAPTAG